MSGEKHVIRLKCSSDEETRKWDHWKTQTFDEVLVDKSLELLDRAMNILGMKYPRWCNSPWLVRRGIVDKLLA